MLLLFISSEKNLVIEMYFIYLLYLIKDVHKTPFFL